MQIKDLISQLQTLYNTYDDEYKAVAGEPEIMIDCFKLAEDYPGYPVLNPCRFLREYAGYSPSIIIQKTNDGVYDILNAFYEDQIPPKEAPQHTGNPWPFPEGGEASFDGPQAKA